jgi:hypothetical protein
MSYWPWCNASANWSCRQRRPLARREWQQRDAARHPQAPGPCHPAWSSSMMACAPGATLAAVTSRWCCMAWPRGISRLVGAFDAPDRCRPVPWGPKQSGRRLHRMAAADGLQRTAVSNSAGEQGVRFQATIVERVRELRSASCGRTEQKSDSASGCFRPRWGEQWIKPGATDMEL